MEVVRNNNFNLFKKINSLPVKKEEPQLSLLLIGSILQAVIDNEGLTFDERLKLVKMHLMRYGLYKTKK